MTQLATFDSALAINPSSTQVEQEYLPQVGAKFLVVAPCALVMIGEGDWSEAVIGCYPSRAAAMHLPTFPGYAHLQVHRIAGLKKALTLVLTEAALSRLPEAMQPGR